MTVAENMSIADLGELSAWWGIRRRREADRVQDMIGRLLIKTPSRQQQIRNLSGGNQQKVIVARWLMRGCPVLILDEPTRGIDVKAKREIHDLLWRIREKDGVFITIVYLLSGFLAAFGGILFTIRMSSGQPTTGANWVMPCITAAIIGGTSLSGGEGSILGTVLGALFMGVLANGIVHMDISPYWERIIIGLVVVLAVVIDVLRTRKRSRS